jgi:hypothetical protein
MFGFWDVVVLIARGTNDKAPSVAGGALGVRLSRRNRQRTRAPIGPPEWVVVVVVVIAAR